MRRDRSVAWISLATSVRNPLASASGEPGSFHISSITPPQTFNQFGTTLGGPIFRNRTFFAATYEYDKLDDTTLIDTDSDTLTGASLAGAVKRLQLSSPGSAP